MSEKTRPKDWLLYTDNAINNAIRHMECGEYEEVEKILGYARNYMYEYWKAVEKKK